MLSLRLFTPGAILLLTLAAASPAWSSLPRPNPLLDDPNTTAVAPRFLPNQWTLRPVGEMLPAGDFPSALVPSPSRRWGAAVHSGAGDHEVRLYDLQSRKQTDAAPLDHAWSAAAWSSDGEQLFVSRGTAGDVVRFTVRDGKLEERTPIELDVSGGVFPGGLALSRDGQTLYTADTFSNRLLRTSLADTRTSVVCTFDGAHAYPWNVLLHPTREVAFVSLRGAAAVAEVDLRSGAVERIATDPHPNAMVINREGSRLFVACANSNYVDEIDTRWRETVESIDTALYPNGPAGCSPVAVDLSPDETFLAVACAGTNYLTIFDARIPGEANPLGYLPTGWYPTGVAYTPDLGLVVANAKGEGSRPSMHAPQPAQTTCTACCPPASRLNQGTIQFVEPLSSQVLWDYTRLVYKTSPLRGDFAPSGADGLPADHPIPRTSDGKAAIYYVVYIIKENRTYDQVFGDLPEGNGDPSLCVFGEKVTPNHHALAKEFVLLDNFYTEGESTADGHEWSTGAVATDYVERIWPLICRGATNLPWPAQGKSRVGFPPGGRIWDRAAEAGITYGSWGEYVADGDQGCSVTALVRALDGHVGQCYPGEPLVIPDARRAEIFLKDLDRINSEAVLPRLTILRLPNDQTAGNTSGSLTPEEYMADNDQALGMILEGLGKSRFWKNMAVFVVEDAAEGPDHVDSHRSVALVAGPWVKRGKVISTLYTTSSILRTIELILGLEPMSAFDSSARPLYDCFTPQKDVTPFVRRTGK